MTKQTEALIEKLRTSVSEYERETEAEKMIPMGDYIRFLEQLIFDAGDLIEKIEAQDKLSQQ